MKQESNLSFLLKISGKEKLKLYIAALFSVLSSVLGILPYILMYSIILELFKAKINYADIKSLAVMTSIVMIVKLVLFLLSGAFSHIAAFTILYELRIKTTKHLSRLNMGFFRKTSSGELKKIINEDVEKLENFIAHQIPDLASATVTPIIWLIYLVYLNWKLSLVLLIPIIIALFMQMQMFKCYESRIKHYYELARNLNSTIVEFVKGMNVMKAFNLTAKTFKTYQDTTNEYCDYWIYITKKTAGWYSWFLVLIDSGLLFIIPTGGYMYLNGYIDVATYILFLILSSNFLSSFKQLMEFASTFSMVLEGSSSVREILETKPQDEGSYLLNKKDYHSIEFDNVSFKYDNEYVLKNFSLKIKPKSKLALVGPSGSGKTTIAQLVGRFWDIDEGSLKINSIPIQEINMENLMNQISFVFQDVFMLEDTIFENVRMGMKKTKEEVIFACKKAQIHDFILSLENGYETKLGEDGVKLSGGEKQRISIARAILKDSPIVILDEVTSYSDIENESKIQNALKTLLKDKTVIIIAHRLYTIKNANEIIVLENGQIKESGNHKSLIQKNGLYKKLWDMGEYQQIEKEVI